MPLKPVIRVATEEDDQKAAENVEKEKKAFKRKILGRATGRQTF